MTWQYSKASVNEGLNADHARKSLAIRIEATLRMGMCKSLPDLDSEDPRRSPVGANWAWNFIKRQPERCTPYFANMTTRGPDAKIRPQ